MHARDMPTKRFPHAHHVYFNDKQKEFIEKLATKHNLPINKVVRICIHHVMNKQASNITKLFQLVKLEDI